MKAASGEVDARQSFVGDVEIRANMTVAPSIGGASLLPLIQTPSLDCDCILADVLGCSRSFILSHSDEAMEAYQIEKFLSAIERRCTGLPVAYIIGRKEFYGRDFFVNESVLIPKPDTEILVERTIQLVSSHFAGRNKLAVVDVCTGSGCIAVSLWKELAGINFEMDFFATDISPEALKVAEKNCEIHDCRIQLLQGDLLSGVDLPKLDVVVSNPPYIPSGMARELLKDGRAEPLLALDGDCDGSTDGTGLIARLVPQAFEVLNQDGWFLMETGEYNAARGAEIMLEHGFKDVAIHCDLSGQPRVVEGRK